MIENSKFNQNSKFKIQNFKLLFFLTIFILQLAGLLVLTLAPNAGQAAELKFKPQVGIPVQKQAGDTFDFSGKTENIFPKDGSTKPIAEYIRAIYKYTIGIVGILAAVVLMIGGVLWIIAGGSATQIGEAKAWIGASLTGLILALLSYLILATVNPALVDLRTTGIKTVAPIIIKECGGITNKETCQLSSGCIWNNGACLKNTSPDQVEKCGLTSNEMTGNIECCIDYITNNNYKYARISLNRLCGDICGPNWIPTDLNICRTKLGY